MSKSKYVNTAEYVENVRRMLISNTDLWGEYFISQPEGPTYEAIEDLLHPLMFVGREPCEYGWLTDSSIYYLPFGLVDNPQGGSSFALHVADGSQIISRRFDGRKCTIFVGSEGEERYGSVLENLDGPRLHRGYLPILENTYTDAAGFEYRQESFATRISQTDSLVSFVKITVVPKALKSPVKVAIVPGEEGLTWEEQRLTGPEGTYFVFSPGASFDGEKVVYTFEPSPREAEELVFVRLNQPGQCGPLAPQELYTAAKEETVRYWEEKLARGSIFEVPEQLAMHAQRNLLIQNLLMNWRYSIGNLYETEFNAESSDSIQALALFGFAEHYKAGLQKMMDGPNEANWEKGTRLKHAAYYYLLTKDPSFVLDNHQRLVEFAEDLVGQTEADPNGLLRPEPGGTDISDPNKRIYSLHFQIDSWRGLRDMATVWGLLGYPELAERFGAAAVRLHQAIRRAVDLSKVELEDGSLFIPVSVLDEKARQPYDPITATQEGSYWLLVAPNSYAPGFFTPGSQEAKGILRYLHNHGAILLGMLRFNYLGIPVGFCKVHGWTGMRSSGVDNVYAVSYAKFLADNDEADRLVMTFYGKLAHGMTRNTFVSAEGEEVDVCGDDYFRSMYLPPNSTNNSLFLHTLRLLLVRETTDERGLPQDLHLAHATPRGWLEHGQKIRVAEAPTLFGPLSFTISSRLEEGAIDVDVDLSACTSVRDVYLRLRTPGRRPIRGVDLFDGTLRWDLVDDETIRLRRAGGQVRLTVSYGRSPAQL